MAQPQPSSPSEKAPTNWREKYLDLIEETETAESENQQQQEQLRRALVRVSLAAEGIDPELDNVLAALREHLKNPKKQHQLQKRLEVVETAVIAFDERKLMQTARLNDALENILQTLPKANPDRAIKKRCKNLSGQLKTRLKNTHELPQLLQEVSALQTEALQIEVEEKPGFLQKLLSGKDKSTQREETDNQDLLSVQSEVTKATLALLSLLEPSVEDDEKYSALESAIESDNDLLRHADHLGALSELVQLAFEKSKQDFSKFLETTNTQLKTISENLNDAALAAGHQHTSQTDFYVQMDDQLQTLQQSVDQSENLDQLKDNVAQQLDAIRQKITKSKQPKASLADQLKVVLSRVEAFEHQAKITSENLSKQKEKALHDALTGLPNREAYEQRWQLEHARKLRYKQSLCLAVVDIDFFKRVNDSYGHQAGDKVLKLIAKTLQKNLRASDFVGRFGGEEFVILLPDTGRDGALAVLEKLRETISKTPFHFRKQPVQITVSIGMDEVESADKLDAVFARADKALYQAKSQGRNQVVVAA